ncbi:MAG: hypothetical protein M3022_19080 [Actinomycetota bacterium]|nr:hypothetical protein [Actinomycetota bacterium]
MALDPHSEALGHPADRPLQTRVVKRDRLTALVTDQVMVVVTIVFQALEAGLARFEHDPLSRPVLDQQIQDA